MVDDFFRQETYVIRGAAFEVYRQMGSGFLEAVYQECLEKEFTLQKIPYLSRPKLSLTYKGEKLEQIYIPDFICYDEIILEIKSVKYLLPEHMGQVLNYIKATNLRLGLLINFGSYPKVQIKRLII